MIKVTNRFVGAISNAERGQPRFGLNVLIELIPDELCADFDGCRRASVWRHQNVANGEAGLEVTSLEREVGDERKDESFFLFLALSQRSQQFDQLDDLTNILVCLDEKKYLKLFNKQFRAFYQCNSRVKKQNCISTWTFSNIFKNNLIVIWDSLIWWRLQISDR